MFRNIRIIGILFTFLFLFAGCGSNGNSANSRASAGASPTIASVAPSNAQEGATVTITGTNFSTTPANNTVSFNGIAAVVTSCTSTQIVTTVPAGATFGPIIVTVGGNIATSATNFTVIATSSWKGTKQLGGEGDDYGNGVAVDSNGNVYVTGSTDGGLDGNRAGNTDMFLVKYDRSGAKQWTRQLGSASSLYGSVEGIGVAVDRSGNAYVAGSTYNGLDGNTNAGSLDMFLVKYDPSGTKQWTRQLGSAGYDYCNGVAVDGSGNVYVSGHTDGELDGNASAGGADMFLVKYDPSGTKLWTRQMGLAGSDYANDIAVDGSGNVYVTGNSNDGLDGNTYTGGYDMFLVKYDPSGTKQWIRQLGSAGIGMDYGSGVAVDGNGNVYVTGSTDGGLDGNASAGGDDMYLVKYDPSGTKLWTRQMGSARYDYGLGVAVDSSGSAYVTGYTDGGLDGNTNLGSVDMFLVKYNPAGAKQWTRQMGSASYDIGIGVAVDSSDNAYVTGYTSGGLDGNTNAGVGFDMDMFLIKYNPAGVKQ